MWQAAHTALGGYTDVLCKNTIYRVMVEEPRQNPFLKDGIEVASDCCEWLDVLDHAGRVDLEEFQFD